MLILAFVLAFAGGGSFALQLSGYLSPYKYETANADYYAAECYRLEFWKPAPSVHTDSDNVKAEKAQAETKWHTDYPPYCDLAAQFVAANSAKSSKNYAAWTLFLTAWGVWLIWRTMVFTGDTLRAADRTLDQATDAAREARDATEIARRQLDESLRPITHLKRLRIVPVDASDEGLARGRGARRDTHKIIGTVENVGNSTAHYCYVLGKLTDPTNGKIDNINCVYADVFPADPREECLGYMRIHSADEMVFFDGAVHYSNSRRRNFHSPFSFTLSQEAGGGVDWVVKRVRPKNDHTVAT